MSCLSTFSHFYKLELLKSQDIIVCIYPIHQYINDRFDRVYIKRETVRFTFLHFKE